MLTARDTSRTGHAKCSNRPRAIVPRYNKGGRMIPRFATSGTMPVSAFSLRSSLAMGSLLLLRAERVLTALLAVVPAGRHHSRPVAARFTHGRNTRDWWAPIPALTPSATANATAGLGRASSPQANTPGTLVSLVSVVL